jgi:hypothetical protein
MNEEEEFLFDLQGYLVIEDCLSSSQVGTLRQMIDAHLPESPSGLRRFGSAAGAAGDGAGFLDWGKPFCDLLDHEAIMPILRLRLGDCFRLERIYGLHAVSPAKGQSLHADYGVNALNVDSRPGEYFPQRDHRMLNGFVVVAWSLADAGPETGGFCCIPGSHKSSFKVPQSIKDDPYDAPCVVSPPTPAGSVVLFSEALMHGTSPWKAEHQRWTLLYKYCISNLTWSNQLVQLPDKAELSNRQRKLFHEPGDPYRFFPSLFAEEG